MFERLLESQERAEHRARRFTVLASASAFTCLVVFSLSALIVREGLDGLVSPARFALMVSSVTGIVSLLAASAQGISLLLGSRAPSLRAIERRLAALESLLQQQG